MPLELRGFVLLSSASSGALGPPNALRSLPGVQGVCPPRIHSSGCSHRLSRPPAEQPPVALSVSQDRDRHWQGGSPSHQPPCLWDGLWSGKRDAEGHKGEGRAPLCLCCGILPGGDKPMQLIPPQQSSVTRRLLLAQEGIPHHA